jgi:hypothetical protein
MLVDGDDQLVQRQLQLARVPCMMRMLAWCGISQSMSDSCGRPFPARRARPLEHADRELEHGLAVHRSSGSPSTSPPATVPGTHRMPTWRPSACRSAARMPGASLALQHHGAGAVAEQHAGAAVVEVEDAREHLGADHQRAVRAVPVRSSRRPPSARRRSPSTRPARRRPGSHDPSLSLHDAGGRRKHHVRRRRGDDDQVDVPGCNPGGLQRMARGCTARSLALTPSSAKWRARMPVRSTIHSSLVSTPRCASCCARSALVRRAAAGGCRCRRCGVAKRGLGFMRLGQARRRRCADHPTHRGRLPGVARCGRAPGQQAVARGIIRRGQRVLEGKGVGRAMALEHQAAQPSSAAPL